MGVILIPPVFDVPDTEDKHFLEKCLSVRRAVVSSDLAPERFEVSAEI